MRGVHKGLRFVCTGGTVPCTVSTDTTIARGIRLPARLWEAIDAAAAELDMTRTEYIRRRLSGRPALIDVPQPNDHVLNRDDDLSVAFTED